MKKNYSHENILLGTHKKTASNPNTFTNSHIQSNPSGIRTVLFTHEENHQNTNLSIKLHGICTIINIHFPQYWSTLSTNILSPHESALFNNDQQLLNHFCKYIKDEHAKSLTVLQDKLKDVEMELIYSKQNSKDVQAKVRNLQNLIREGQQKISAKQLDRFNISQQIFNLKQKNQQLQKQLIIKNIQIQQIFTNFQKFKQQAYIQITKYQEVNKKLKIRNKKNFDGIQELEKKVRELEQSEKPITYYYREVMPGGKQFGNRLSYQHNGLQYDNYNNYYNPIVPVHCDCLTKHFQGTQSNITSSATLLSSKLINGPQEQERIKSTDQLLLQIKQLKTNQSDLLDHIAQRDEYIQNLQSMIQSEQSFEEWNKS